MYLRADSVNAQLVDSYNQVINSLPALTRGLRARLILKLLDADGQPLSENLNKMVSWDFVIADDWSSETALRSGLLKELQFLETKYIFL